MNVSMLLAVTRFTPNRIVRRSLPCDVLKLLRNTYAMHPPSGADICKKKRNVCTECVHCQLQLISITVIIKRNYNLHTQYNFTINILIIYFICASETTPVCATTFNSGFIEKQFYKC